MSFKDLKKQSKLGSLTAKLVKEVEKMNNNGASGDERTWKLDVDKLQTLLEKQKTMWTRLSLSDDPEAKEMKNQLRKSLQGMGFPEGTDMPSIFSAMDETIDKLKESVD